MPRLPSEHVDIDFNHLRRAKGWLEQSNDELMASIDAPAYEEYGAVMVPRSEWKERVREMDPLLRACIHETKNQGREGSCVAAAATSCFQFAAHIQFGARWYRRLSAMSLYKRIGRTAGSGSYIPDAVKEMSRNGALPLNTSLNQQRYEHTHPATGFSRRLPRDWKRTAKHFRITQWLKVDSIEEWMSALLTGKPIVYGRSRHAIMSFLPRYDGNRLFFGYLNSWGQWGDHVNDTVGKGLGWDSERTISRCVGWAAESLAVRDEIE